jgi:hypothetical protein
VVSRADRAWCADTNNDPAGAALHRLSSRAVGFGELKAMVAEGFMAIAGARRRWARVPRHAMGCRSAFRRAHIRVGGNRRAAAGSDSPPPQERNRRSLHYATPDFLWRLMALANSMRLSLMKAAYVAVSSAAWQEIRVRSGRDDIVPRLRRSDPLLD